MILRMHFHAKTEHDPTTSKSYCQKYLYLMTAFSRTAEVQFQVWMSEHASTIDSFGPDLVLCVQDDVDQTDSSVWIVLLPLH